MIDKNSVCKMYYTHAPRLRVVASVTRFGKIPPLWQIFKIIWQYIYLFGFGQSLELTLAQFVCYGANFHCCKWPKIKNTIWSFGYTGGGVILKKEKT